MKWGVRRYQNADGSLTPAGKKHYSSSSKNDPNYNLKAKDVRKNMDKMTDAELQRAINRLNMQQQVDRMNPSAVTKGRNAINRLIADVTMGVSLIAAYKTLSKWGVDMRAFGVGLYELLK
jgi:hypothetical protein